MGGAGGYMGARRGIPGRVPRMCFLCACAQEPRCICLFRQRRKGTGTLRRAEPDRAGGPDSEISNFQATGCDPAIPGSRFLLHDIAISDIVIADCDMKL